MPTSELSQKDFFPDVKTVEAPPVQQPEEKEQINASIPETLQNATNTAQDMSKKELSASQQADIEQIKLCLLQNMTEEQMAEKLKCHRTTISRKITAWMKTPEFNEWIDTWWLKLGMELSQNEDTKPEVFKQLTRLKCAKTTKTVKADVTETIEAHVKLSVNADLERYENIIKATEQQRSGANTSTTSS
jgi:predicted DNA-binding protein (UPF0251 family)